MNRLLNLTGLRAFEAVPRVGSFGKAAAELNLTSTAISHAVRKLEREIGCELFTRRPRPVRLTAEGQTLFVAVNEAFGDIGRTAETLNGKRGMSRSGWGSRRPLLAVGSYRGWTG
jgi:LysR family glycine cleavage system transcriptional activator